MVGIPTRYVFNEHILLKPEMLAWCKRQAGDQAVKDSLFVYRHVVHGTFVLARWITEDKNYFVDLVNMGTSLAGFTKDRARYFVDSILNPMTPKEIKQDLEFKERHEITRLQNENAELKDHHVQMGRKIYA